MAPRPSEPLRAQALLLVLNPRRIPECLASLEALEIDVCWLSRYSEWQLQTVFNEVVEATSYRWYLVVSDDGVVSQEAIDLVLAALAQGHPVVTGYSNVDERTPEVLNLTKGPVVGDLPRSAESYGEHWLRSEVEAWPEPVLPTGFAGMSLTGMSRELWLRYPFVAHGSPGCSWGSDWALAVRLRDDGVPIVAARGAFVWHVKAKVNEADFGPGRGLLVGREPAEVRYQLAGGAER